MTARNSTPPSDVQIKPIPGYPGYYATTDGRILKELKGTPASSGHIRVSLRSARSGLQLAHRLILETFVGPCPPGMQGCHDPDHDPANNNLSNLRWDTCQANHDDRCRGWRQPHGSGHPMAKLSEDEVREIRTRVAAGASRRGLALRFKVSRQVIAAIVQGKTWKHITDAPTIPADRVLTELQAARIISLRRGGMKLKEIAEMIGTTFSNVSLIALGKSWRGLHEEDRWRKVLADAGLPVFDGPSR